MDSYIVHIYRRDQDDPELIAGLVELVQRQERRPFTSLGQLKEIIASHGDGTDPDPEKEPRERQDANDVL